MPGGLDKLMGDGLKSLGQRIARPASDTAAKAIDRGAADKLASTLGSDTLRTSLAASKALAKRAPKLTPEEIQALVTPKILREPHDPAFMPNAKDVRSMTSLFKKNAPREAQALKTLEPKERATYHALQKQMSSRIDGKLGLQQLLLDGKLTIASSKDANRNLIAALGDLSKQKLDPAIDRETLMAQLHQELADPVATSQMHKGTCAATSNGQILFSLRKPTDYTDFVAGLASPKGEAKLPNGALVKREADWRAGNDRIPSADFTPGAAEPAGRTITGQLTEPAFMQYAMGPKEDYSNTFDEVLKRNGAKAGDGGLYDEQSARLLSAIFPGEDWTVGYLNKASMKESYQYAPKSYWPGGRTVMNKQQMLDSLASTASVDNPIPTSVDYELDGGHAILTTNVHDEPVVDAKGKPVKGPDGQPKTQTLVDYINPWGRYEQLPAEGFLMTLQGMITNGSVAGVKV